MFTGPPQPEDADGLTSCCLSLTRAFRGRWFQHNTVMHVVYKHLFGMVYTQQHVSVQLKTLLYDQVITGGLIICVTQYQINEKLSNQG